MGSLATAKCQCGYSQPVSLGGGFRSFREFCGYPYICYGCKRLFTGNLHEDSSSCRHCDSTDTRSYEHRTLSQPKDASDNERVFDWYLHPSQTKASQLPQEQPGGVLVKLWRILNPLKLASMIRYRSRRVMLRKGGYLCPKCNEFRLIFVWTGMFD